MRAQRSRASILVVLVAACRLRGPSPQGASLPDASPIATAKVGAVDAGTDAEPPAPRWAEVKPRFVKALFEAMEPFRAFAVGGDIFVVRRVANGFRMAQLRNDKLVDEDAWSRGLPSPQKSRGEDGSPCNELDAVFGRSPDRLWLVENSGGSMTCSSTFGEYVVWRRKNGSWSKDAAHSPPPGKPAGGVFATWPLGPTVLGAGVSNLVGDTLTSPVDAMWTLDADPWATVVHLPKEGWNLLAVCASATGVVAALSVNGGAFSLETIERGGARSTNALPPGHAPEGTCAVGEKEILLVEPPVERTRGETWLSFDRKSRAWRPIDVPWPYRTTRLDFLATRIVAWTATADGRKHVFLGTQDASAWMEVVGLPDGELEVVSLTAEDEAVVLVDRTKLVRVGLPRP